MPFTDRFQLLDLKRDEGARTYEAREIATGRPVFVHLFANSTAPLNRALLAKLDTLPEEERHRIIDRGAHEGGVYVVTDRLAEYPGLREWLKAKSEDRPKPLGARGAWQFNPPGGAVPLKPPVEEPSPSPFDTAPLPAMEPSIISPPPVSSLTNSGEQTLQIPVLAEPPASASKESPTPVVPAPPAKDQGEFTRQFAPPALPKVAPPAAAPTPSANDPGEFTRQFAPPVLRPAPPPAKEFPPAAAPTPSANDPGEFTRQFAPTVLRPAPPATPARQDPGEFTQLFSATPPKPVPQKSAPPTGEFTRQFQAPQRPVPPRAPAPAPNSVQAQQNNPQPGEFTQMLQAQRPAIPAPANQAPQGDEFSRYFQSPMSPSPQGQMNTAPLTPPRPPSHPKDAGEFTQIFGRGDMPSAPPGPAPAAPPNAASGNATQVFATPRPAAPMPMGAPNVSSPLDQRPLSQGPGEYTQMFAKPASLTFGQAPSGSQAPRVTEAAPIKRNSSRLPLLLVMGAASLLIIALIVYLVMRPHAT